MEPGPNNAVNAQLVQYVLQNNETAITCPDCEKSKGQFACDSYSEDHTAKLFCTNCNEQFEVADMREVLWSLVEDNEELAQLHMIQEGFGNPSGTPFD